MSYYRNTYLKSEDWKQLRMTKLRLCKSRCSLCGISNPRNDVHHVKYRKLYDVMLRDLRVVCRCCHDKIHELMARYPKMKTLGRVRQWKTVKSYLKRRNKTCRDIQHEFSICRNVLSQMRLIQKKRMKWSNALFAMRIDVGNPISLLNEFMRVTGTDPRCRADRMGSHRLLCL